MVSLGQICIDDMVEATEIPQIGVNGSGTQGDDITRNKGIQFASQFGLSLTQSWQVLRRLGLGNSAFDYCCHRSLDLTVNLRTLLFNVTPAVSRHIGSFATFFVIAADVIRDRFASAQVVTQTADDNPLTAVMYQNILMPLASYRCRISFERLGSNHSMPSTRHWFRAKGRRPRRQKRSPSRCETAGAVQVLGEALSCRDRLADAAPVAL